MRAVIQRVSMATLTVDGELISSIGRGLVTLIGVKVGDTEDVVDKTIRKIIDMRIFSDRDGKMNLSLKDVNGQHLIISQFTLLADAKKGNRPSYLEAERPQRANELYLKAISISENLGVETKGGIFGADMKVTLTNDGPVTIVLES